MEWEVGLIEWFQKDLGEIGAAFSKVFSFIGGETGALLVLLFVLFCWRKETGQRLVLIVTAVNSWLPMIKAAVLRPRPYMEYPDRVEARVLVESGASEGDIAAQGYSFPSTHSATAAAMLIPIAAEVKKRWMWITAIVVVTLVGISRVAVGMHYPTDVLAGWALGLIGAWIIIMLEKFVKNEWIRHLILAASALPGFFFVRTQDYYTSLGLLIGSIAAIHFEKKFVGFRDTRNIWAMILRVAGAVALYFVLNTLLKLPFSKEFLSSATMGSFLVRAARYAVIIFAVIGVYPKVFPLYEKIGRKTV